MRKSDEVGQNNQTVYKQQYNLQRMQNITRINCYNQYYERYNDYWIRVVWDAKQGKWIELIECIRSERVFKKMEYVGTSVR